MQTFPVSLCILLPTLIVAIASPFLPLDRHATHELVSGGSPPSRHSIPPSFISTTVCRHAKHMTKTKQRNVLFKRQSGSPPRQSSGEAWDQFLQPNPPAPDAARHTPPNTPSPYHSSRGSSQTRYVPPGDTQPQPQQPSQPPPQPPPPPPPSLSQPRSSRHWFLPHPSSHNARRPRTVLEASNEAQSPHEQFVTQYWHHYRPDRDGVPGPLFRHRALAALAMLRRDARPLSPRAGADPLEVHLARLATDFWHCHYASEHSG